MEVAKELVVKIGHLQEKGELGPLADLVASLSEHSFSSDDLINSGLSKLGARAAQPGAFSLARWRARASRVAICAFQRGALRLPHKQLQNARAPL